MLSKKEIEIIFKRLYVRLCLFANHYLKSDYLSEDIVSSIFAKYLESNKIYGKTDREVNSYFFLAVKNKCLDHLKSNHTKLTDYHSIETLDKLQQERFFYKTIVIIEAETILYNAIKSLPNRSGEVIKLSLKKKSNKEIAAELKISVRTVQKHKENAHKMLRQLMVQLEAK